MELLHMNRCTSPLVPSSAPSTFTPREDQTMHVPVSLENPDAVKYVGPKHFLDITCHQYDLLQKLETDRQVFKFQPVTEEQFEYLSGDATRPSRFVKLQYHRPSQLLLAKVMPGWDHENIAAIFRRIVERQLILMGVDSECLSLASPRNELGNWIKEPDLCWAPVVSSSKPTFVVEIGTSESAAHLATDAHDWLEASHSPVHAVVTICFKYQSAESDSNPLTISIWRPGHELTDIETRNHHFPAAKTSCVKIRNNSGSLSVSGFYLDPDSLLPVPTDEIRLPLEFFVGRQASRSGEHDVVLDKEMLLGLLRQLWEYRRQRRTST
ncbi:hypothetical protein BJX76DRAFT_318424 [Aspergillus varians]